MRHTLFFGTFAILLISCSAPTPDRVPAQAPAPIVAADAQNTRNTVQWTGTYRGTLPCADCEATDVELSLSEKGYYRLETFRRGRSTEPLVRTGEFGWERDDVRIFLNGIEEPMRHYRVSAGYVMLLDADGSNRTGTDAPRYQLNKDTTASVVALTGTKWILEALPKAEGGVRLSGQEYVVFEPGSEKLTGSGGCNNFTGVYKADALTGVFTAVGLVATEKACATDRVEQALWTALGSATSFIMKDGSMELRNKLGEVCARFKSA